MSTAVMGSLAAAQVLNDDEIDQIRGGLGPLVVGPAIGAFGAGLGYLLDTRGSGTAVGFAHAVAYGAIGGLLGGAGTLVRGAGGIAAQMGGTAIGTFGAWMSNDKNLPKQSSQ
ncbi:hypothetical protein [Roseateles sp.]|uniref:hypothetical protein n=1 Tax=Roseateles sp. TaxID=1971397 RepID=UPI0031CDD74F